MDKRTEKTKACITQALAKLLDKKSLDSITVTELAKEADINRKTFYAHYGSIQDVIDEACNEMAENLISLCVEMSNDYSILNPDILFRCLNALGEGDPEKFGAIFGNRKNETIIHQFMNVLCRHIKSSIEESRKISTNNSTYIPFISAFIAGGLINTYCEWGLNYPETDLETVTHLTSRLILSGISPELDHGLPNGSH